MSDKNKPTMASSYDYSKLVDTARKGTDYKDFSTFIDEKIHEIRSEYYDGNASQFNRSTLAKMIGIDCSTLTKIINGSQTTRKRDIIIAICFALRMNKSETAKALDLYSMARLNCNNLRDLVIEQALCDHLSVAELNSTLESHQFPPLNILRRKKQATCDSFYYPFDSTVFKEISVTIQPYCIAGDAFRLSLRNRYRPDQFDYYSEMTIQEKEKGGELYRISLNHNNYEISKNQNDKWEELYSDNPFALKYSGVRPCDKANLLNEISKLREYTDRRAKYIHNMCKDTRNYKYRLDAINNHGELVIYGEQFGFDNPELCEYFQIEISSSTCLFTVSNVSLFLEKYLGHENWMELYGEVLPTPTHSFTSISQIANPRWCSQFQALLNSAQELLVRIQQHEVFLFNVRDWMEIDELLHIFKAEEAFDCIQPDDQPYDIVPQKDYFLGADGDPITINDLYRALELDINTLEDLCETRIKYGSLENFLQINLLSN